MLGRKKRERDQSVTVDVSRRWVKTLFGYKMVPLPRRERERLRRHYEETFPEIQCVEKEPPAPRRR